MAAAPARANVINLMDALKKSLEDQKPPAKSKSREPVAKKAAPKASPKRKRA
jgi:DNA end-binding protein Ku